MVWAVDLDDGTLINALGANLNRKKAMVFNDTGPGMCTFGTLADGIQAAV